MKKTLFIILFIGLFSPLAFSKDIYQKATFAGGCFWCMEPPFEKESGVISAISGYSDGEKINPTYKQVSSGMTKHVEAVQIIFDPKKISYEKLLKIFWTNIDPTDMGGQFVDRGYQYTTAIFTHNQEQMTLAIRSKKYLEEQNFFKKKIVTPIKEIKNFYPAVEYHQDFYKKSLLTKAKYKYYRAASGRDHFIKKYWSKKNLSFDRHESYKKFTKPSREELKKILTPLQFQVTQEDGTERPFKNKYWNNKEEGIYVDIVSGEPLFSSTDQFKSGTGWPSFTKPINKDYILEKADRSLFGVRTEIRSIQADSHLGHIFKDGPAPTFLRYCVNSASLRFIKKSDLKKEGLEYLLSLFK